MSCVRHCFAMTDLLKRVKWREELFKYSLLYHLSTISLAAVFDLAVKQGDTVLEIQICSADLDQEESRNTVIRVHFVQLV